MSFGFKKNYDGRTGDCLFPNIDVQYNILPDTCTVRTNFIQLYNIRCRKMRLQTVLQQVKVVYFEHICINFNIFKKQFRIRVLETIFSCFEVFFLSFK